MAVTAAVGGLVGLAMGKFSMNRSEDLCYWSRAVTWSRSDATSATVYRRGDEANDPMWDLAQSRAEAQDKPFKITGGGTAPYGVPLPGAPPLPHAAAGNATHLGRYRGQGRVQTDPIYEVLPDPPAPDRCGDWLRVPAVVDDNGDKVVTLYDEQGCPHTRLVAEIVLETFVGPRPQGHVVRFKDANRLNCELSNLEWVAAPTPRDEAARARAIATRQRADATRHSLEGRQHSDSAELVAEDRLR
jgi:hypothetical protein